MHIEGYPTADRLVALETETGRAIEDYLLHHKDLTAAFDIAQLLGNLIKGNLPQLGSLNTDRWVVPIWTAVIQKYYGCFSSSARTIKLDANEVFASEDPLALENHQYFKDLRDKHFVHDVNSFTQSVVGAVLEADGTVVDILRIHFEGQLGINDFQNLINLIDTARKYVNQQMEALVDKARKEIEALPPEDRLRLPQIEYSKPEVKDVAKRRSAKQRNV